MYMSSTAPGSLTTTTTLITTNLQTNHSSPPPVEALSAVNGRSPLSPPNTVQKAPVRRDFDSHNVIEVLPNTVSDGQYPVKRRSRSASSTRADQAPRSPGSNAARKLSPYERTVQLLANDPQCQKELTLGKRVGMYKLGRELGSGNFSKVKIATHVLIKEKVAIKVMDKAKIDYKAQRLLQREISNMEQTHHPNIIRLFEVIDNMSKMYLVLEFAGGGELYSRVVQAQKLSEAEAKMIFAQIISAVVHLHDNHIIHRDIKAENVFFSSYHTVKLGDFGFSIQNETNLTSLNTFCGSPPYAAPELFRDNNYVGEFVDIWALGVLIYFMVTGNTPFRGDTVSEIKKLILVGEFHMPTHLSEPCANLITGILQMDPPSRLRLADIVDHSWLKGQEFPKPVPKISLTPNENNLSLDSAERDVWNNLDKLGITQEMLRNSESRDARHSIIGIYRIALYQVHKRIEDEREVRLSRQLSNDPGGRKDQKHGHDMNGDPTSVYSNVKGSRWKQVKIVSRACIIL